MVPDVSERRSFVMVEEYQGEVDGTAAMYSADSSARTSTPARIRRSTKPYFLSLAEMVAVAA